MLVVVTEALAADPPGVVLVAVEGCLTRAGVVTRVFGLADDFGGGVGSAAFLVGGAGLPFASARAAAAAARDRGVPVDTTDFLWPAPPPGPVEVFIEELLAADELLSLA